MPTFTAEDLRELAQRREQLTVSILMPVDPASEDLKRDPVRFKQLLDSARETLVGMGRRGPDADALLAPGRRLLEDRTFWRSRGKGLAVYLGEGFERIWRVPVALAESLTIHDEALVLPLMGLVQQDGTFYVLAASQNGNRLLECTRREVKRLETPGAPRDLADAIRFVEEGEPIPRSGLARGSVGGLRHRRGPSAPMMTTQGFGEKDRVGNDLHDYFLAVDQAIRPFLSERNVPLVFAGLDRNAAIFAAICSHPFLASGHVGGNPDLMSDDQLREAAWAIVGPLYDGEVRHHLHRFHDRTRDTAVSSDLLDVLPAAMYGRVDTLFVAEGASVFGRFDPDDGRVEVHAGEEPGDVDLVNEAARLAYVNGANVFALPREQLPEPGGSVSALLRW